MEDKYEILKDDFIKVEDKTLYRIRALQDFGDVKIGQLGGYIGWEFNLSHNNTCWIYDNAKVYGNAQVYDNAKVYDNATVYGHSKVYGCADISDDAIIYDKARIFDNAMIFGNAQVYYKARVFGNAQVYGEAKVSDYAIVSGDTQVFGNALINGNSIINIGIYSDVKAEVIKSNDNVNNTEVESIEKKLKYAKGLIRQVLAITMLEYEDMNCLAGDIESRSRNKEELLQTTLKTLEEIREMISNGEIVDGKTILAFYRMF